MVSSRTVFGAPSQHVSGMVWNSRFLQYSLKIRGPPPPPELMLNKKFWRALKTWHKLPVAARRSLGAAWLTVAVPIRMNSWYRHFLGVGAFAQNPKIAECIGDIFLPAQKSNNKHWESDFQLSGSAWRSGSNLARHPWARNVCAEAIFGRFCCFPGLLTRGIRDEMSLFRLMQEGTGGRAEAVQSYGNYEQYETS